MTDSIFPLARTVVRTIPSVGMNPAVGAAVRTPPPVPQLPLQPEQPPPTPSAVR